MRVHERPARDLLRLLVWYPLRYAVRVMPPAMGFAVLRGLGRLHAALAGGRRARLERAAGLVAPELSATARRREAVAAFETHYANQLSVFVYPGLTSENWRDVLEIEGLSHLEAARRDGRGAVVAIGHYGPTQLPLTVLGLLGFPMVQIGYLNDAGLSFVGRQVALRLRRKLEARIPARIVEPGAGTRQALAHVRTGGVVMTTIDDAPGQPAFGRHGTFEFPGGGLEAPLGAARLALSGGAVLLPGLLTPGTDAPYRLRLGEPIPAPETPDRTAAATAMTAALMAVYGEAVRARPGWWHLLETRAAS